MTDTDMDPVHDTPEAHPARAPGRRRPRASRLLLAARSSLVTSLTRRWLVRWATGVTVAAEIAVMAQRGMPWRGDLLWTIDWLPVAFIVVGPVVAGCVAIDTARTAHGATHLFRRPVHHTPALTVAVSYLTALVMTHLLVLAGALLLSMPPVGDRWAVLAVVCQVLILAFFVALGSAVGRFARPVPAGACGALAAFALLLLADTPTDRLVLLDLGGGPTIPRIGYAYDPAYLARQAVALLLAVTVLLVLRPLDGRRPREITRGDTATAAVVIVAVAGVVAVSSTVTTDRLRAIDARPTTCGAVSMIPTCFHPQHERVATAFQERFWVLVEVAREKGYEQLLPSRVVEAGPTRLPRTSDPRTSDPRTSDPRTSGPGAAAFHVMPNHLQGVRPTLGEIARGIVQPTHCPQVQGDRPPSERYWNDLDALTATWVELAEPGAAEDLGYFGDPLSPTQAATILTQFRTCTYPHF